MAESMDLDADIEALDDFLMSDDSPEDCMMLCDLDGFLTGIAVGPELILPSEWLPVIWGTTEPVFKTAAEAQFVLGTIMKLYNQILAELSARTLAPIFMETPAGDIIASDWAEGFMQAVNLRPQAWEKVMTAEKNYTLPIAALCCNEQGGSLLELDEHLEDSYFENAGALIPEAVIAIADYWNAERGAETRQPVKTRNRMN